MTILRRNLDRRRRVLYSAHQAAHESTRRASRQETERLREARRPGTTYGSRVHRPLQGRWFSLVPVRRRTIWLVAGGLFLLTALLCVGHYAAVAWPPMANRPQIARPLRLDRPDSFGRWLTVALLTTTTGVALLIYQLRRHRNDDFAGQYRLWRTVMIVTGLASLNALVSLIDWSGALVDALIGRRVALTGSDWVRLFVTFGGAILFLQMINELRRCKPAAAVLVVSLGWFAIPELANWNILQVDSLFRWTLVTCAPPLACTSLFLASGIYLRALYREVRKIPPGESLRERLQRWQANLFQRDDRLDTDSSERQEKPSRADQRREQKRRQQQERQQRREAQAAQKQEAAQQRQEKREQKKAEKDSSEKSRWSLLRRRKPDQHDAAPSKASEAESNQESSQSETRDVELSQQDKPPRRKRQWFKRRARTTAEDQHGSDQDTDNEQPAANKKRWFSLRLKPPAANSDSESETADRDADDEYTQQTQASAKRGLDWLRRRRSSDEPQQAEEQREQSPPQSQRPQSDRSSESYDEEDEDLDADDIDWNSLSKAERRRMRKQLKRQRRAA